MDSFTREEAKFLCKSFADKVFNKADEEDRLGVASKATAKTFYAAATFLQIVDQFCDEGDEEEKEEIKKKVVYSKVGRIEPVVVSRISSCLHVV